jgi:hypothetical protein
MEQSSTEHLLAVADSQTIKEKARERRGEREEKERAHSPGYLFDTQNDQRPFSV